MILSLKRYNVFLYNQQPFQALHSSVRFFNTQMRLWLWLLRTIFIYDLLQQFKLIYHFQLKTCVSSITNCSTRFCPMPFRQNIELWNERTWQLTRSALVWLMKISFCLNSRHFIEYIGRSLNEVYESGTLSVFYSEKKYKRLNADAFFCRRIKHACNNW